MRIVFVDNLLLEFRDGEYKFAIQPHLGLISLIAVAEQAGHQGFLYDPKLELQQKRLPLDSTLYRRIADAILRQSPDVVGLTALGCNFICTTKIAGHLKAAVPDLPILLGGPHATILAREILSRFPQFDLVVRHEAELTLLPVLDALKDCRFDLIPGLTFRKGNEIVSNIGGPLISDLDSLPWPAYHSYPINDLKLEGIPVEAGRGCPFHCTFCSTASFFGRKFRLKSATRLGEEMDFLHATYGINHFTLTHDLFTVNRKKVVEFCEFIAPRHYSWSCSARMDCVDEELLETMREAGCGSIYYGIETGSERMQQVVEKRQDLSIVEPTLDVSHRIGMFSTVSLITGYPQETQSDQDDTLNLVGRCLFRDPALTRVQLHLLTPEPGTKLISDFADALEYDGHITDFNFPTLEADDAEVMARNPQIFMNHHYYRSEVPRQRHVFVTSIFQLLYELGHPLVRHMMSFYEGSFSRLTKDMYDWSVTQRLRASDELIIAFVASKWGAESYLHSLVRYIIAANQLTRRAAQEQHQTGAGYSLSNSLYRLNPRASILSEIHDCGQLLDLICASKDGTVQFSREVLSARADYCILIETLGGRTMHNYKLDEGWTETYRYFEQPRSYNETVHKIGEELGSLRDARVALRSLLKRAILQACPEGNIEWAPVSRLPSYAIKHETLGSL